MNPDIPNSNFNGLRALHLFTLCSLAFTQPTLTALARHTVYLHDQKIGWAEIGALLVVLSLFIPIIVVAVDRLIQQLSKRLHGWGRNIVLIGLISLILLSLVRPYCSQWWYIIGGDVGLLILATVIPCAWMLAYRFEKYGGFQFWLTLTSSGIILFPAMFVWQIYHMRAEADSPNRRIEVKNAVPVILIVFDEFSGTTLMNERAEIDQPRFPHFARLASLATWYRNATTVSPRTDIAVPAILSGRFPLQPLPPLAADYPGNLLQLIEGSKSYEMSVFEPISRLCPQNLRQEPVPDRPHWVKSIDLVYTLTTVYPRLVFSSDTPIWFPRIPKEWFGVRLTSDVVVNAANAPAHGMFNYPGTEFRDIQQTHVLKSLNQSSQPLFCFFHTVLPHYPWSYLPSGDQYQSAFAVPECPSGGWGELGEDWDDDPSTIIRNEFRYRLQVGYVDRFIGQILDRLESTGLLDRCLLVVTADHGVSFRPGHSRRLPDSETLPDIFSVPLFIKYPGQSQGITDDRNVESIDIFPTIAEILGMKLTEPIDGIPISSEVRRPRKTMYFEKSMTVMEPDFPQRSSSVRRQFAVFGSTKLEQLPPLAASHPEWHGRSIASFTITDRTISGELFDLHDRLNVRNSKNVETITEPCLVIGSVAADDLPSGPAEIVLVTDGIIRDTGKSYWIDGRTHGFQFLRPEFVTDGPPGTIELYVVEGGKSEPRLCPLKITTVFKSPR